MKGAATRDAVAERLADFVCAGPVLHADHPALREAKRLLLNQLKATAEAAQQPQGRHRLMRAAAAARPGGTASLWWHGASTTPRHAAALHRRLTGLLDFGDSHGPAATGYGAALVPLLMAHAQAEGQSGHEFLRALAVGTEVALACAALPGGDSCALAAGRVAALAALRDASRLALSAALQRAVARLSGDPGQAVAVLDDLGSCWRLHDIALHCRPLPLLAQAPVDALLSLRPFAGARLPRRMQLSLSPEAWPEPAAAPGAPRAQSPLDLRLCLAAAWQVGGFGVEEREAVQATHPALATLAACLEIAADPSLTSPEVCTLRIEFEDGSLEAAHGVSFPGSHRQPLHDGQLSELFRSAAEPLVLPLRAGEILQALWTLDAAPDVRGLVRLLQRGG